jgi:hypothetical protein
MNHYITPSSNAKGEGTRISVRVPPELYRLMDIFFSSKRWPYQTFSDLVRHALFNHVEWLDSQDSEEHGVQYLVAMANALVDEEMRTSFRRMLSKLHLIIQEHEEAGEIDDASRVVNQILGVIRGMPDGSMKARYERDVRESYGHLAGEIVEAIKLVDLDPRKAMEDIV